MTSKTNTFEGQPSGTSWSVANSGGGSGDAWNALTTSGTVTAVYDSAWAMHGSVSLHITGQASSQFILRSTGYNGASLSARIYARLASSSAAQDIVQVRNGSGQAGALGLSSSRQLQVKNALGGVLYTFGALAYLSDYRAEIQVTKGVATSAPFDGVITAAVYAGDSRIPIESYTSAAVNTGTGNLTEWRAGKLTSGPSLEMFLDSAGAHDVSADPMGPFLRAVSGSASVQLAATGAGGKVAVGQGAAVLTVTAAGVGRKLAAGSGIALVPVAAAGAGRKVAAAAGTAVVQLTATGAGRKRAAGGAVAAVPIAAFGAGQKRAAAGGYGTIALSATGAGQKRIAGSGTAVVTVMAAGVGTKRVAAGGIAAVPVAAAGSGRKIAAGGGYALVVIIASGVGQAIVEKPFTVTVGAGYTRPGVAVGRAVTRAPTMGAGRTRSAVTVGPGREA
ncbi:hypothetical protein FDO65_10225 [Nakamurella flava]|uniref:Uncharacterized protein n=1 Tax=Nakamurella flava TaxID=2576308 RepID=A0A4U6QN65_9ACTN|nr:hypothetical protein [Nakamurella flava]TKV61891.1 hypothetical protein FDO65_10225 [Nakamurella flava]